jgi:hypothetical protein
MTTERPMPPDPPIGHEIVLHSTSESCALSVQCATASARTEIFSSRSGTPKGNFRRHFAL